MVRGMFAGGVGLVVGTVVGVGVGGGVTIGVEVMSVVEEVGGGTTTPVTMGLETKPAPPEDTVEATVFDVYEIVPGLAVNDPLLVAVNVIDPVTVGVNETVSGELLFEKVAVCAVRPVEAAPVGVIVIVPV